MRLALSDLRGKSVKWTKRLKWIRISKIVIPIALAISLVFAGFTVYAHEADNFVVRINNDEDVKLSLTLNRDLSGQTSRLVVPVDGFYEDVTYEPSKQLLYGQKQYDDNLPDDIAKQDGIHNIYCARNEIAFYAFSFWLVNNSERAVDVDMILNIDEMTVGTNRTENHIDDAVRVMIVEDEPLLSDGTYTVYKKAEKNEENQKYLDGNIKYGNTVSFLSDMCIFERSGLMGYQNVGKGETLRFTVVIWLEGWDPECIDDILEDNLKMSLDFIGH